MRLKQPGDGLGCFANWQDFLHVRVRVGSVGAQPMRLLLHHLYDGLRMLVVLDNVPDLLYGTVVRLRFLSGRVMVGVAVIELAVCLAPLFHETNVAQVVMMRHGQHQQHHEHCQPKTYYERFSPHHNAKVAKDCCNSVAKCASNCSEGCGWSVSGCPSLGIPEQGKRYEVRLIFCRSRREFRPIRLFPI